MKKQVFKTYQEYLQSVAIQLNQTIKNLEIQIDRVWLWVYGKFSKAQSNYLKSKGFIYSSKRSGFYLPKYNETYYKYNVALEYISITK